MTDTRPTADEAALLAAILAHPEEDDPRLRYADLVQEQGREERAEFIRLQVRRANLHCQFGYSSDQTCDRVVKPATGRWSRCEFHDLCRREREFLDPPNLWLWYGFECFPHLNVAWSRGFIDTITCRTSDWLVHGDAIRRAHPVTRVRLTTEPRESDFELQSVTPTTAARIRLWGREWTEFVGWEDVAGIVVRTFEAAWPGVAFELPAAAY